MSQFDLLKRDFVRAGVPFKLADGPFAVANAAIVQMDVSRSYEKGRLRERILLWPGEANEVHVTGVDPTIQQLVLGVRENVRTFVERVKDPVTGTVSKVVRETNGNPRRFLVGMDEAHLFVAQLTTLAGSVAQAHAGLRPKGLRGRQVLRRQGEWFFVVATADERAGIELVLDRRHIHRGVGIGSQLAMRGRPHVASELVRVRDETGTKFLEFVRGEVRHPDHKSIEFEDWVRVFMNTENRTVGATWVD